MLPACSACLRTFLHQVEEAEIENLIQKEQKQVERLEWLLETVQKDYAYFNYLQQRFEEESRGGGQQQQQSRW
jgi:membrane-anchored protein YejM (alkaline phosphatase superfamily)